MQSQPSPKKPQKNNHTHTHTAFQVTENESCSEKPLQTTESGDVINHTACFAFFNKKLFEICLLLDLSYVAYLLYKLQVPV